MCLGFQIYFPKHVNISAAFVLFFFFLTKPLKVQKESQECYNNGHVMSLSPRWPCKEKTHPVTDGNQTAALLASHS